MAPSKLLSAGSFVTNPVLASDKPQVLENGDIRMAFAKAGQSAYSVFGEECILSAEFFERDSKTYEGGVISINHQNNSELLGSAKLVDVEYDGEFVWGTFSNLPDRARKLIDSEFYEGTSQECIPIEFRGGSSDLIKGYGLGVTLVTYPYTPAATQDDGVGIPPAASCRPPPEMYSFPPEMKRAGGINSNINPNHNHSPEPHTTGGTTTASETELQSARNELADLKSTVTRLESENTDLTSRNTDLVSRNETLEKQVADFPTQIESAVTAALESDRTLQASKKEREDSIEKLKAFMSPEIFENYMSTEPTTQAIKSMAATLKQSAQTQVGSELDSTGNPPASSPKPMGYNPRTGKME